MKKLVMVLAAVLPLSTLAVPAFAEPFHGGPDPQGCSSFSVSAPSGAKVESVNAVAQPGGTVTLPTPPGFPAQDPITSVPAYCDITVTLTHRGADDHVRMNLSLPQDPKDWSGRFQAVGGSAYAAGDTGAGLVNAVKQGYAAATTDAGVGSNTFDPSAWARNPELVKNFSYRSLHDLAVVGKDVTKKFYGRAADYAYWNGCSTGGRQGYLEAQENPGDFQGILADAAAVNWDEFAVASLWPNVVMNQEKDVPTPCEFNAFNQAVVKACDTLDGARDGLLNDPRRCDYDPRRLIGTTIVCDGKPVTISAADATVVRKIWEGPTTSSGKRLWYGLAKGASFSGLAGSATAPDGTTTATPFFVAAAWVRDFLKDQPDYDLSKITYDGFEKLFHQSQEKYDRVIGTDDPDLSGFRKAGGKLLSYHGWADQLIATEGSVDYRQHVDRVMGGTGKVDDFYRLFLAPGVDHCGFSGPKPTDPLGALVKWVEKGKAPDTLTASFTDPATGAKADRDLCRYPLVSRYAGHGDLNAASSFRCVGR